MQWIRDLSKTLMREGISRISIASKQEKTGNPIDWISSQGNKLLGSIAFLGGSIIGIPSIAVEGVKNQVIPQTTEYISDVVKETGKGVGNIAISIPTGIGAGIQEGLTKGIDLNNILGIAILIFILYLVMKVLI